MDAINQPSPGRMSSVRATLDIARPRGQVYAYAADYANRARLSPVNFSNVRVLTDATTGPGARYMFTIATDRGRYQSVTEMIAVDPPHAFRERTTEGATTYESHWSFTDDGDHTSVTMAYHYLPASGVIARVLDRLVGRRVLRRSVLLELVRLKQLVEGL